MKKHWIALLMAAASPVSLAGGMEPPAIQGEAMPVARTENTVAAWTTYRAWMSQDWFMRAEIHRVLASYASGKLRELPVIPVSGGEVLYPLGHVLPILQTAPVAFSQVILGKGVRPVSLIADHGLLYQPFRLADACRDHRLHSTGEFDDAGVQW